MIGVGIHKHPKNEGYPYYARICVKGKQIWLGYFRCQQLACEAYNAAVDKYKPGSKKNTYIDMDCAGCDECIWEMIGDHGQN